MKVPISLTKFVTHFKKIRARNRHVVNPYKEIVNLALAVTSVGSVVNRVIHEIINEMTRRRKEVLGLKAPKVVFRS